MVPGDEVHAAPDEHGGLAALEVLPAGGPGERLHVAAQDGVVVVRVQMPALDGPPASLVTRWAPCGAASFAAVDGDAGTIAFARQVLGAAVAADDPLAPVDAAWSCSAALVAAHGAATGAGHAGAGLDLALPLAWPALAGLLSSAPFAARLAEVVHAGHAVTPGPAWPPAPGERGRVQARVVALDDPDGAPTRMTCRAELSSARGAIAVVEAEFMALGPAPVTDLRAFLHAPREAAPAAPAAPPVRHARPRVPLATAEDSAPPAMDAFARVAGDHNPLHRCVLAARLGGLARPIVHGAWTAARASAFVIDDVCAGDATALRRWRIAFLAPVALGAALELQAARVALQGGLEVVEVTLLADGELAATGEAWVAPPRTVLTFCGQGVQRRGLGADGRARSRAARGVWERADACTRARLGFSLLDVVERNPTELRLAGGRVVRHPDGVLARTELAQPALVALARGAARRAARGGGAGGDDVLAAGHSVGEFSALVALGALELEAALELVFARGELMQREVARDAAGRLGGPDGRRRSGGGRAVGGAARGGRRRAASVELVNHNALGRQYADRGQCARRSPHWRPASGPAPCACCRGSTSRFTRRGWRRPSSRCAPSSSGTSARSTSGGSSGAGCRTSRAGRSRSTPDGDARTQLIDLLARQIASPVQWVRTQRALLGPLGARRIVELGPAGAPVLTGLMRLTLGELDLPGKAPELLHVESDRDAVLALTPAPVEVRAAARPALFGGASSSV